MEPFYVKVSKKYVLLNQLKNVENKEKKRKKQESQN